MRWIDRLEDRWSLAGPQGPGEGRLPGGPLSLTGLRARRAPPQALLRWPALTGTARMLSARLRPCGVSHETHLEEWSLVSRGEVLALGHLACLAEHEVEQLVAGALDQQGLQSGTRPLRR